MDKNIGQAQTTSEVVAGKLRRAIILGEYRDGDALKQDILAAQYSVSKIPVREALNLLKAEGLVTFQNNRGSIVSRLSVSEVEEIYSMRVALESMALERAVPKLTSDHWIPAEAALKRIDESRQPEEWPELNWEFHASLYRAAQMPRLLETASWLHNNVARYLLLYLKEMEFQDSSQKQHWDLLDACVTGKQKQALSILNAHLSDALEQTVSYMKQRN